MTAVLAIVSLRPIGNSQAAEVDFELHPSFTSDIIAGKNRVFAGDLDGDGDEDLIVTSSSSAVAWFENRIHSDPQFRLVEDPALSSVHAQKIMAADYDQDGDQDLFLRYSQGLIWYVNRGGSPPTFERGPEIAVASGGYFSTTGVGLGILSDLDGDGDVDVIASSSHSRRQLQGGFRVQSAGLSWFENDGSTTPSFSAIGIASSVGEATFRAADPIDLDGDGDLDLLVRLGDQLLWYQNVGLPGSGEPVFARRTFGADSGPVSDIASAIDVDADGDLDVLSSSGGVISLFVNDGTSDANFSLETFEDSSGLILGRAIDFDGDGDLDSIPFSTLSTFDWFENLGEKQLSFRRRPTPIQGDVRVLPVDLNGDGGLDLFAGEIDSVAWYRRESPRGDSFTRETIQFPPAVGNPSHLEVGDMDGDSRDDIVFTLSSPNRIMLLRSQAPPVDSFSLHRVNVSSSSSQFRSVHLADLNADGLLDIISSTVGGGSIRLSLCMNDGGEVSGFNSEQIARSNDALFFTDIATADIDSDGYPDIVVSGGVWYRNRFGEGLGFADVPRTFSDDLVGAIELTDLDDDGDIDIVSESGMWFENNLAAAISFTPHRYAFESFDPRFTTDIAVADFDGDGDKDIFTTRGVWAENVGGRPPSFISHALEEHFADLTILSPGDIDLDGDLDFFAATARPDSFGWIENTGRSESRFVIHTLLSGGSHQSFEIAAADLDRDGDLDAVVSDFQDARILWVENKTLSPPPLSLDFSADRHSWTAQKFSPEGAIQFLDGTGLCIAVPEAGENLLQWEAPGNQFIDLAPRTVYRVRFTLTTDQTAQGAQPLWNIAYGNFHRDVLTWGGFRWFLDHAGGANGIGSTGRGSLNEFDAWVAPIALDTAQWNGAVDEQNGAFSPMNDEINDFGLMFRVLDFDSAGGGALGSQFDSGTICLRSVRVDAFPLDSLLPDGPPIYGTSDAVPPNFGAIFLSDDSLIDTSGGQITIELAEPDGLGRAFLGYEDTSLTGLARLFPIPWNDHELLRVSAEIVDPAPTGAPIPVDVIGLNWEAATDEIGGIDLVTRGQAGGVFDRSGSPHSLEETFGVAQKYMSFFWTHHATDVDLTALPDANRLRAIVDFFNRDDIAGPLPEGKRSDPVQVRSFVVERIALPPDYDNPD